MSVKGTTDNMEYTGTVDTEDMCDIHLVHNEGNSHNADMRPAL